MGELRERMVQDLRLAGYSASTRRIYLHYAKEFARHFRRSPEILGEKEIRRYLLHLLDERQLSHDTYRQAHSALKFLFSVTLKRRFDLPCVHRQRRPHPLPDVLSGREVRRLFENFRSPKYRVAAMMLYGAGLRVSEACRLRARDIDSRRMLIHVRLGKGRKDRFVTLSRRLLDTLRVYWRVHQPEDHLFPGRTLGGHVSPESLRAAVRRAAIDAGIRKRVTPHLLRHSYATHLLETGTDINVIRVLLGHKDIQVTTRYTKISKHLISRVRVPLDLLEKPEGRVLG
jgi:site-specific recombinase XerD